MIRVPRFGRLFIGLVFMLSLALLMLVTTGVANSGTSSKPAMFVDSKQQAGLDFALANTTLPSGFLNSSSAVTVFLPSVMRMYTAAPPLCRYGVAAWGRQLQWLPTWRAGWTLDFGAHAPPSGIAAEFVQVIRVRQKKNGCEYLDGYNTTPALTEAGLGAVIRSAPGAIWLVGNEPDRGPNPEDCLGPVQDDTYPEMYARVYHDVYHFIKQRDPKALIANAGLVQVTPGRLQYLDRVWQEYQSRYGTPMPVDIWNMHLYILPEVLSDGQPNGIANIALGTDPALGIRESGGNPNLCGDPRVYCFAEHDDMAVFAEQVVAMRAWMKEKGQQNKPLILTEYSLLYPYDVDAEGCFLQDEFGNCFTPERVNAFMKKSFAYLENATDPAWGYPLDGNRLVQRWMWFSANYSGAGRASNLLANSLDRQTLVGEAFQSEVASKVSFVNLLPGSIPRITGYTNGLGRTATVTLSAEVFNNGSVTNHAPVQVAFYADESLTDVIGTATLTVSLAGCASRPAMAHVAWSGLSVGPHRFWVKVNSNHVIKETSAEDNVSEGVVVVYERGLYLPVMLR